jgi:tellurite resistance protein TerC
MGLLTIWLGTPLWMWLAFFLLVAALLALDLGVLHRRQREIGVVESLSLSALYIALGLAFGGWLWWQQGAQAGMAYLTGFMIEKSLAIDNVFVIAMIFATFGIPRLYQHRVLFWGIAGVIVLRAIMIGAGAALVARFDWMLYLFAGFLVITGVQMWRSADQPMDIGSWRLVAWIRRRLPVTDALHGDRFWVRLPDGSGRLAWRITPLFLALLTVEFADIIFAVDSVPAIFTITTDPFIVYTSNIFAILGLRALYFALAAMVERFRYLKYALSLLLVFIGAKIFVADLLGLGKIPPMVSLGITASILAGGILWSLFRTARTPAEAA